MSDARHPAYDEERQRLALTLKAIDREVQALRQLGWSGGAVAHAAFQIQKQAWEKSDRLLEIRSSPYFGRIDILGEDGKAESHYIGPEGLAHRGSRGRLIIDWRAPISAAFYRPDERTNLKRRIQIDDASLIAIADEYVRASNGDGSEREARADPMLHEILSQARGNGLGSIVRSIQATQDALIRAGDRVMVVQGAAGTGKTVVALHRLAYLLYQSRASGLDDRENSQIGYPVSRRRISDRTAQEMKVAVFGPNRAYLRHIRAVLPSLGERDAVETSFVEWIQGSWLGDELEVTASDDDLEQILNAAMPHDQREHLFRRARAKGSIEMSQLLSRYVSMVLSRQVTSIESQPIQFVADVAARPTDFRVELPKIDVQTRLATGTPLNLVRDLVRERMRERVREEVGQHLAARGVSVDQLNNPRQYTHVLERFDSTFERRWPRWRVSALFMDLLRDETQLREAAAGIDIQWQWLHGTEVKIMPEDVAPMAYLALLAVGPIPIRSPRDRDDVWTMLDHIVVDEVQDLPPLALKVLQAHTESLTVLGDMNQAIYAHRGTRSWREAIRALGREARQIHTLSVSYRSTQQISDLANHVVRVGGLDGGVSRPFPRKGSRPVLQQAKDQDDLRSRLVDFITEAVREGSSSIAVLTRTAADARAVFERIVTQVGVPSVCISDRYDDREAPVIVMPAYLAKGIEFDDVTVVDVDKATYSNTVNDATLLYVAITRALHHLLVVWCGTPSPLIAGRL